MEMSIRDFFTPLKLDAPPSATDYDAIKHFVQFANALAKVASNSIYLIDYYKRGFHYVSDNPIFLCGKSAKQVQQLGYLFYFKNVPEEDLNMLLKINKAGFEFYGAVSLEDRMNYSITYDFRLKQHSGHLIMVNHRLTPLALDKHGNIWIALCVVSPSSNLRSGNVLVKNSIKKNLLKYDLATEKWHEVELSKLSNQEKKILLLSIQGYTVEKIACELFLARDTIKFHRKNILRKLNASNISEAIFAAVNYGII